MTRKKKLDSNILIRIQSDKREEYAQACKDNDTNMSKEITAYIDNYVENNNYKKEVMSMTSKKLETLPDMGRISVEDMTTGLYISQPWNLMEVCTSSTIISPTQRPDLIAKGYNESEHSTWDPINNVRYNVKYHYNRNALKDLYNNNNNKG